ncbi:MAG: RCC1 domain-containing protein, partial [Longimicrobiales bacterium]
MSRRFLTRILPVAVSTAALSACEGPDVVLPLRPMEAVAVGVDHSCGLAASGEALCWGDGTSGQLGRGNTLPERFARPVDTGLRFASIVAGGWHTCALTADGTAYCWGANESGQLGIPGPDAVLEPRAVETDLRFTALSAGWAHTCGIAEGGAGYCWGRGSNGELGTGVIQESAAEPAAIALEEPFIAISAGGQHSCGVVASGPVYCWGANLLGQLGNAENTPAEPAPVLIDVNRAFVDVAAGYN